MSTAAPKILTFEQLMLAFEQQAEQQTRAFEQLMASFREDRKQFRKMQKRHAEIDRLQTENALQLKEIDQIVKENALRQEETARQIKQLHSEIGGIGKSNVEYAEQFFIRAVRRTWNPATRTYTFGGREYKDLTSNKATFDDGVGREYDIVLHNGEYIAIIEVKYKFKKNDLVKFLTKSIPDFRILFSTFADKKINLGIAGFSFEDGVVEEAKSRGIGILRKDGKNVEYDAENLKTY